MKADGIRGSGFYAGTGTGGTSTGTIGTITGTGIAEAAFGDARANGISYSEFVAGGSGTGSIGTITGVGTATGHTEARATGIEGSHIQAAVLSGGSGTIGAISGTATATSQAYALAEGIRDTGIVAGYIYGKIGNVSGTGTANGETGASAAGITGRARDFGAGSYGFEFPGGYTLLAGTGVGGKGIIGTVTGTAVADMNTSGPGVAGGEALTNGIWDVLIKSGYSNGTIGTITGTATSTSGMGESRAYGIGDSDIYAGFSDGGVGAITGVYGTASATSESGSAHAIGIEGGKIESGFLHGTIGNVYGVATATVIGSNLTGTVADAYGIKGTDIYAGFSGNYGKIGNVKGTATATIYSSYEATGVNKGVTATATAVGIYDAGIYAAAKYGTTGGVGIIGSISGTGTAKADGFQVKALGVGIEESTVIASNGPDGSGTIALIYGYGHATAASDGTNATALAYGLGGPEGNDRFSAGTGLDSVGHITGNVYGKAIATASAPLGAAGAPPVPAVATATAMGIDGDDFYVGDGSYGSKGYMANVTGAGTATATGGTATSSAFGINGGNIKVGRALGTLGNVMGTATATATSYYGNATTHAHGIHNEYIGAGLGDNGVGTIGNVDGTGTALSTAKGTTGNAYSYAYGIDPTNISAGSVHYTTAKSAIAGSGTVLSITGIGTATSVADGIDAIAKSTAFGIDGLKVYLGTAYSKLGNAQAGTGSVTNGITGTGTASSTATDTGGNGFAHATGIAHMQVYVADATGYNEAKGGTGTVGKLTATATATVNAANNAYVYTYGLNTVTLSAGNATDLNNSATSFAFGGTGTIGAIYQKQTATATGGTPTGIAKAYAEPIVLLSLLAGNAYGGAAYGGTGDIALGGSIEGIAVALATGYNSTALAIGLASVKASAGNAVGSYYANDKAGVGYVGQLIGTATATATSNKLFGSVSSKAKAYGIYYALVYAGNAEVTDTGLAAATGPAIGGHGTIAGFVGTATATATSTSPFNGYALARANGIHQVYAYAGNASNHGSGPAKTFYGKIGSVGAIVGTANATASTKGGASAESLAYGYGISEMSLNAANAATYGGGIANAKNAYAFIAGVKGYATVTGGGAGVSAYAYGKTDPISKASAYGVFGFTLRAGNAFVESGGTGTAYAAGSAGGSGQAIIQGMIGQANSVSYAKGVAASSLAQSIGIAYGTPHIRQTPPVVDSTGFIQGADAYSSGAADGGIASVDLVYGLQGTATAKSTATVLGTSPASAASTAIARGIYYVRVTGGDAYSYGYGGTATGGTATVGAATGLATSTGTATGSPATVFSTAYGIGHGHTGRYILYEGAANASGANAYAGTGTIDAVTGTGTATATATGLIAGAVTTTNAYGTGLRRIDLDAANASAPTGAGGGKAVGGTGTIVSITGTGSATANSGATSTAGHAYAYSAGVKDTYAHAGDATGKVAIAGLGTIGPTIGSGTATATGFKAKATSFGVDPVKLYAGYAYGYSVATGGAGSSIGAVTGTAISTATGASASGYAMASTRSTSRRGPRTRPATREWLRPDRAPSAWSPAPRPPT